MITLFVLLKKLIKFLNSNESVTNIAYSSTIAACFALLPFNGLVHTILLLALILFNGNLFIFLFFTPIFELFSIAFYPLFDKIGNHILSNQSFESFFSFLYQLPVINFTNWNNSIMMGSLLFTLVCSFPLYFFYKYFLTKYREKIMPLIQQSKLRHLLKLPSWLGKIEK